MPALRLRLIAALAMTGALLGTPAAAQHAHPTPQPVAAAPAEAAIRPALWKVADADTTIYLFGTIHLLPKGGEWLTGPVAQAFGQAQELVTEIPEVAGKETTATTLRHGAMPAGQSLRDLMNPAERTRYEAALGGLGLPPGAFDKSRPWLAAVALATIPLVRQGYSTGNGVEAQLERRNKALGRPRIGLETLDYQLGLFNTLPEPAQKAYLFDVIESLATIPQEVDRMVAAWARGDAAALAELLNGAMDDPQLYEVLLSNRNRNWAGWIDQRLDQPGVVFVAVGAGHLGGKDSVQDLLAKAGIETVRVQ